MFKEKKEKRRNKCDCKNINIYTYQFEKRKEIRKKDRNLSIKLFLGFIANADIFTSISKSCELAKWQNKKHLISCSVFCFKNIVTKLYREEKKQKENDNEK